MSEAYDPDNLLDRHTSAVDDGAAVRATCAGARTSCCAARLGMTGGDVLSVGCGWNPGRHAVPRARVADDRGGARRREAARRWWRTARSTRASPGRAGELPLEPESFDVVLYRLVLHHVAYQGPLAPVFEEAARLLRPGGALVAVEPGALHPVGAGLAVANRLGLGTRGARHARRHPAVAPRLAGRRRARAGLAPRAARGDLHLAPHAAGGSSAALWPVDARWAPARARRRFGHTLMLIARR